MKYQSALFVAVVLLNVIAMAAIVRELSLIVAPIERVAAIARPVPRVPADIAAFETSPTVSSWKLVEDDLLSGQAEPAIIRRLVEVLAYRDLPPRLINVIVVDLSSYDMTDSIRWLHYMNVVARTSTSGEGPAIVRRTAHVMWLLLVLRPNYGTAGIDLTRMDLRTDAPFIGQRMNLSYIDFSDADLPGGNWNESNLSSAAFGGVHTSGPLRCENCTFGGRRIVPDAQLQGGVWTTPSGSKETP